MAASSDRSKAEGALSAGDKLKFRNFNWLVFYRVRIFYFSYSFYMVIQSA